MISSNAGNTLIQELGETTDSEPGQVVQVNADNVETFAARLTQLATNETTLDCAPINLAAFPDPITLSPDDLLLLGPLVTDPA